jgi:hypothetical protein
MAGDFLYESRDERIEFVVTGRCNFSTLIRKPLIIKMERAKGFEPSKQIPARNITFYLDLNKDKHD